MKLFSEIEADAAEMRAIIRGLYTVARVDGLDDGEVAFISNLFPGRLDALAGDGVAEPPASLEPPALAALLPTPAVRKQFLKAAYLLAWTDGKVSFAERASIDAFAAALGVEADLLARCEAEVKDHLLLKHSAQEPGAALSFETPAQRSR